MSRRTLQVWCFGGGFLTGALISYLATKRHVEARADEELEQMRRHFLKKADDANQGPSKEDVITARKTAEQILLDNEYADDVFTPDPNDPPTIVTALGEEIETDEETSDFDMGGQFISLEAKSKGRPYLISYEEFADEHGEFDQDELTWYAGDATLCDSRDELVDDVDMRIGEKALDFFGWRSYDENVVYIRNENLAIDFTITFNPGSYSLDVLGDVELTDPRAPKIRKMRWEE